MHLQTYFPPKIHQVWKNLHHRLKKNFYRKLAMIVTSHAKTCLSPRIQPIWKNWHHRPKRNVWKKTLQDSDIALQNVFLPYKFNQSERIYTIFKKIFLQENFETCLSPRIQPIWKNVYHRSTHNYKKKTLQDSDILHPKTCFSPIIQPIWKKLHHPEKQFLIEKILQDGVVNQGNKSVIFCYGFGPTN